VEKLAAFPVAAAHTEFIGVKHYCTYFDRGFLIQGLALWRSLATHDSGAVLWVLALDDFTAGALGELDEPQLHVVRLAEMEAGDADLVAARADRSRVEYYFTLSPCWPRWLLAAHADIDGVTYLDADLFFFDSPAPIFSAMAAAGASVLVTAHRFPSWLQHYERHGRFNVGILSFRNNAAGRACLDDWRARCLAWCCDRVEDGKYADQKYLDEWPARFGAALLVLDHPGVNLAPWNWPGHRYDFTGGGGVSVEGAPLVLFHFARFRPLCGDGWWQSGQLPYGVMPWRLRNAIYGPYWRALMAARAEIAVHRPEFDFPRKSARLGWERWHVLVLRLVFGSDWLRLGDRFISGRCGLGRWSGYFLAKLRIILLRA
jgi:hypothetical protein